MTLQNFVLLYFCYFSFLYQPHLEPAAVKNEASVTAAIRAQKNSSPNTGALEYCDQVQLCDYIDAR